MEFDQVVYRLGAAVVRAVGGEVAEERVAPLFEGLAEAGDLGDRARSGTLRGYVRPSAGELA